MAGASPIAPGAHIEVRDAVWRVLRVDQTSAGTHAWTVVGVSEIVRDQEAVFLEDYERNEDGELAVTVLDPKDTRLVGDPSEQHRGTLVYLEALLRDVPPADDGVAIGHRAAFDLLDFQLDPARLALGQLRLRVLVVTVKSMLMQFQMELWSRFTIPLVRLDSVGLRRIRARIPTNHNPFYHFDRVIISIDTLKQKNGLRHHLEQARWDVVVIDEAQNVAQRGSNSLRAQLASMLSTRTDALVLLSATPHDGRPESFASLMNMLDPTAIANPKNYGPDDIRGLFVRRFKQDVQDQIRAHFPDREVSRARVPASAAEEDALTAVATLNLSSDQATRGGVLFRTGLEKALLSSPQACLQTLRTRIGNLQRRKNADALEGDVGQLQALERQVGAIGKADFSRYQRLVSLLKRGGKLGWSRRKDDRLVLFTERIETLKFLHTHLPADLGLSDDAVRVLHGTMPDVEQQEIVEAFGKDDSRLRLVIASDVASEGINLHYLCHRMIHFDVPWSLMVFQQRNGRIDRYGQEKVPQILYLLVETTHDDIQGDVRILDPLELLLGEGAAAPVASPPAEAMPSLYNSNRAWLTAALDLLRDTGVRSRPTAEAAFVISGLVPNRQGQPVVHRWYAAVYSGVDFTRLQPFAEWLGDAGVGQRPQANLGGLNLDGLQALLPDAVERAGAAVEKDRDELDSVLQDGPHERTIVYRGPFDRCNREDDYRRAWAVFAERFSPEPSRSTP